MRNFIALIGIVITLGGCAPTWAGASGEPATPDDSWIYEQRAAQAQSWAQRQQEIAQQLADQSAQIELSQRIANEQMQAAQQLQNDQQMLQQQMQQNFQ
jgi:hypothetical protein